MANAMATSAIKTRAGVLRRRTSLRTIPRILAVWPVPINVGYGNVRCIRGVGDSKIRSPSGAQTVVVVAEDLVSASGVDHR